MQNYHLYAYAEVFAQLPRVELSGSVSVAVRSVAHSAPPLLSARRRR